MKNLNYIFENSYNILKTKLYDNDKKNYLRYVNNLRMGKGTIKQKAKSKIIKLYLHLWEV